MLFFPGLSLDKIFLCCQVFTRGILWSLTCKTFPCQCAHWMVMLWNCLCTTVWQKWVFCKSLFSKNFYRTCTHTRTHTHTHTHAISLVLVVSCIVNSCLCEQKFYLFSSITDNSLQYCCIQYTAHLSSSYITVYNLAHALGQVVDHFNILSSFTMVSI